MSARRLFEPLSPISTHIIGTSYTYNAKVSALGDHSMDERARIHDDGTQASGDSILSGLTSLENDTDTDEFGRLLIQRAKDEQRIRDALRGSGQPFRKARPPRIGLTLENLERQEILERSGGLSNDLAAQRQFGSPASVSSSERSDPPIRVPQGWGRKGRQRNEWMRRILDVREGLEEPYAERDNIERSTATADLPAPSIEGNRALAARRFEESPSAGKRVNDSLERIREWEISEDLTMGSLLASTPAVPKNRLLDEILEREIESLKEDAAARSQEEETFDVQPEDTPKRRPSSSSLRFLGDAPRNDAHHLPAENGITLPKRRERGQSKPKSPLATGDENQAPSSPILVYKKSTETVGIINREIQANAQTPPQRPAHRRYDSQDLLRKLARATSASPSPKRILEAAIGDQVSVKSQQSSLSTSVQELPEVHEQATASEVDKATANQALENNALPEANKPAETGAVDAGDIRDPPRLDLPLVAEQKPAETVAKPMPSPETQVDVQTPKVTGAWINTPAPETGKTRFFPSSSSSESESPPPAEDKTTKPPSEKEKQVQKGEVSKPREPSLPSSALEAVIGKAKSNHQRKGKEDALGDSTIDSLEDLIHSSPDDTTNLPLDEDTLLGLQLPAGTPKTAAERQRRQEILMLQAMNARLKAARTSIRDAGRGMKRVEHQVDAVDAGAADVGDVAAVCGQCKRCGCPAAAAHASPLSLMWTACKKLFYDKNEDSRITLTRLGIISLAFLVWLFSETVLCSMYCQPRYARTMVGYGVNPDAPRLPFVTTTILFRPFAWFYRPILGVLQRMFESIYQVLTEEEDTSESIARTTAQAVAQTAASYTTQVIRSTMEAELGFMDDEYI